ncbi:MAG: isopenicillin N synthase family dioxygenase [Granulosicoccus sp.]
MLSTIPQISATALFDDSHPDNPIALERVRDAAENIGFMTLTGTTITTETITRAFDTYHRFFLQPATFKRQYDMAATGSNRGWGAPGAEQVDPNANPDYKEVFDSGLELAVDDPLARHTYYAPNLWPQRPARFQSIITDYYQKAAAMSLALLSAVAVAIGEPADYFVDKFDKPMALLRGNYYPPRPDRATSKDFGIAPHTDYGCLTLLATDGSPGLEVKTRNGRWIPITAAPGTFVINFGEMLQMWTRGRVVATPHRVIGGVSERLSIPFFFNPRYDVNVAPSGSSKLILAGEHLSARYNETYLHRQKDR